MPLNEKWASPADFATLFQYFWYRDFPMDAKKAIGVGRVDWTIHIGVVVRNIADLMGLVTRFERGGRKDAVLRSTEGDEIAIEWEWGGVFGKANELKKLKDHTVRPKGKERLRYAVLITYSDTPGMEEDYKHVLAKWQDARWPLLLILIERGKSTEYVMGKDFKNIEMSLLDKNNSIELLRRAKAFPWEVNGTRWSYQMK